MTINQTITLPKSSYDDANCGSECMFIADVRSISDRSTKTWTTWGLKVYRFIEIARRARLNQIEYWEHQLAPQVGELVRVKFGGRKTAYYAYFTEQIMGKMAHEYLPQSFDSQELMPWGYQEAVDDLVSLGHTDVEEHHGNVMFCTTRQRWLAVDFGALSNRK